MRIPAGYELQQAGSSSIAAHAADLRFVVDAVDAAGSLHDFAGQQPGVRTLAGRGAVHVMPGRSRPWVVRHYSRGGAVAGLLGDRYVAIGTPRPFAELLVSERARERGIQTPRVIAAVVYGAGSFYRGDLATELVAHADDLADISLGARPWPFEERVGAWRAAGAMLRMCFESGLVHPDLNLKNVLIERTAAGPVAHVIDLDRARIAETTSLAERESMLSRFDRSRVKIERRTAREVSGDEQRALLEGLRA